MIVAPITEAGLVHGEDCRLPGGVSAERFFVPAELHLMELEVLLCEVAWHGF
jgi:hypothetical protein